MSTDLDRSAQSPDPVDVCIAFAHDDEHLAQRIEEGCRNQDLSFWWFKKPNIGSFLDEIAAKIRRAAVFVVIVSDAAIKSAYVPRELALAIQLNKEIVPVSEIDCSKLDLSDGAWAFLLPVEDIYQVGVTRDHTVENLCELLAQKVGAVRQGQPRRTRAVPRGPDPRLLGSGAPLSGSGSTEAASARWRLPRITFRLVIQLSFGLLVAAFVGWGIPFLQHTYDDDVPDPFPAPTTTTTSTATTTTIATPIPTVTTSTGTTTTTTQPPIPVPGTLTVRVKVAGPLLSAGLPELGRLWVDGKEITQQFVDREITLAMNDEAEHQFGLQVTGYQCRTVKAQYAFASEKEVTLSLVPLPVTVTLACNVPDNVNWMANGIQIADPGGPLSLPAFAKHAFTATAPFYRQASTNVFFAKPGGHAQVQLTLSYDLPPDLDAVEGAEFADVEDLAPGSREALQRQKEWVAKGFPLEVRSAKSGISFRLIPPGESFVGSPQNEAHRAPEEPVQGVRTISRPFYMSKYELTHGDWRKVTGDDPANSPHWSKPHSSELPAYVTMVESEQLVQRLAEPAGEAKDEDYRLPTEEEWEFACRAGTRSSYYTGEGDAALLEAMGIAEGDKRLMPVGGGRCNAWGLFNMHGNIAEWCSNRDRRGRYTVRGGSFMGADGGLCRSSAAFLRYGSDWEYVGLRLVCPVPF